MSTDQSISTTSGAQDWVSRSGLRFTSLVTVLSHVLVSAGYWPVKNDLNFFPKCLLHASGRLACSYGDGRGQRESKQKNKETTGPHLSKYFWHGNEAMDKEEKDPCLVSWDY